MTLDFEKGGGRVAVVTRDARTGAVLMVAGIFVTQETQLMAQFANTMSSPPAAGSSLGAMLGSGVLSGQPGAAPAGGGTTINGTSAVETMMTMLITARPSARRRPPISLQLTVIRRRTLRRYGK